MSLACAEAVARDDPHLHATALFAPEPLRGRLMVLYAFDCALSRAAQSSAESMIPLMRLQWWSDVIDAAAGGAAPRAHEVAGPLTALVTPERAGLFEAMVQARRMERAAPLDADQLTAWSEARFGARLRLAAMFADAGHEDAVLTEAAAAQGAGYALRSAAWMAARGGCLLDGLRARDLAHAGEAGSARAAVVARASAGLAHLAAARSRRAAVARGMVPALLPLMWEERAMRALSRDPALIAGGLDRIGRPFDGARLVWRAMRGRW